MDEIFEDINQIVRLNNSYLLDVIAQSKKTYNNGDHVIQVLEQTLKRDDSIFKEVHDELRYDSAKRNWLKETNFLVEPIEISLNGPDKYQYIPIIETVSAILQHDELKCLYFKSNSHTSPSGMIRSFRDSENCSKNELFSREINNLQLITYNDEFDTNNPLGDNRKEDKIHAVYLKIGRFSSTILFISYLKAIYI